MADSKLVEAAIAGAKAGFLRKLSALTREYGIEVWGCGCCGSPDLMPTSDVGEDFEYGYKNGEGSGIVWRKKQ